MSLFFATSQEMTGWLANLAGTYHVLAPVAEGPAVVFRAQKAEKLATADIQTLLRKATASPKQAVLPQSETLVSFKSEKDPENPAKLNTMVENPCAAEPTVLFGCRPCDARGFVVLDRPYLDGKFKDPYYAARREATIIVTQACSSVYSTCFCHWVGSNPVDGEGSDILFTAIEGGFVLNVLTEKGEKIIATAGFAPADDKGQEVEAAHNAVFAQLSKAPDLRNAPAKVASRFTDNEFWEKETVKCLSCSACTFLCPTCQCFTITDEGSQLNGKRIRSWDSCMSPLFTLETSGHNPRPTKANRMRNRIEHKYSYYPERYDGFYSCVGCGRCTASCPVSLDIRTILVHAVEGAKLPEPKADAVAPAPAPVAAPEKKESPKSASENPSSKNKKKK